MVLLSSVYGSAVQYLWYYCPVSMVLLSSVSVFTVQCLSYKCPVSMVLLVQCVYGVNSRILMLGFLRHRRFQYCNFSIIPISLQRKLVDILLLTKLAYYFIFIIFGHSCKVLSNWIMIFKYIVGSYSPKLVFFLAIQQ